METAWIFRSYVTKKIIIKKKYLILVNVKQNVSRKEACAFEVLKRGKATIKKIIINNFCIIHTILLDKKWFKKVF